MGHTSSEMLFGNQTDTINEAMCNEMSNHGLRLGLTIVALISISIDAILIAFTRGGEGSSANVL